MKFRTLLTAVLLLLTANVHAQTFGDTPFGFKMGMSLAEAKALEGVVVDTMMEREDRRSKKKILALSSAPVKDDRFGRWELFFTEKHGLYKFHAISKKTPVGTGGQGVMPKYVAIREDLTKAYNGYTRSAYVEGVGAWETAGDWLLSVATKSQRGDGRAFISHFRPGFYKKSETLEQVEISLILQDPAVMLLIFDFHNSFAATYGR